MRTELDPLTPSERNKTSTEKRGLEVIPKIACTYALSLNVQLPNQSLVAQLSLHRIVH